jgi:hypothetical protein
MSTIAHDITEEIGYFGRMISGSKIAPKGHTVFFNACIFDESYQQIWWGDFDLTADSEALQKIATRHGSKLYVTREQPFRWDGLSKKQVKADTEERIVEFKP